MTKSETPVADKFMAYWDENRRAWDELSNQDLYALEAYLWGIHQDALMEWTRRQMREKDPRP